MEVYKSMVGILKLRNIQAIIVIHLIGKIGFQANDAITNLKLLDKGFSEEDMALTVLIDFPFEISLGYLAGRWSTVYPPIHVWCWAFVARLFAALIAQATVMIFPADGVQPWYLLTVIGSHIFSTFSNTVMFVAISAFHAKIADPAIGGTYMTLLATYVPSPSPCPCPLLHSPLPVSFSNQCHAPHQTEYPTSAAPFQNSSSSNSSTHSQSPPASPLPLLLKPSQPLSSPHHFPAFPKSTKNAAQLAGARAKFRATAIIS